MKHLEMMNSSRAMDPVAYCMAEIHDMKFSSTFPLRVLKAVFALKGRKYICHGQITIIPNPELRGVLGDSLRITRRFGHYDLPRQKKDHKPKHRSGLFFRGPTASEDAQPPNFGKLPKWQTLFGVKKQGGSSKPSFWNGVFFFLNGRCKPTKIGVISTWKKQLVGGPPCKLHENRIRMFQPN